MNSQMEGFLEKLKMFDEYLSLFYSILTIGTSQGGKEPTTTNSNLARNGLIGIAICEKVLLRDTSVKIAYFY